MKAKELKRIVATFPDDMDVFVETYDHEQDDHLLAPVTGIAAEHRCCERPALFISGSTDPEECPPDLDDGGLDHPHADDTEG